MRMLDKLIIRSVGITPCASGWDVTPAELLSFSKADRYHELVTRCFILHHNLMIHQASLTM